MLIISCSALILLATVFTFPLFGLGDQIAADRWFVFITAISATTMGATIILFINISKKRNIQYISGSVLIIIIIFFSIIISPSNIDTPINDDFQPYSNLAWSESTYSLISHYENMGDKELLSDARTARFIKTIFNIDCNIIQYEYYGDILLNNKSKILIMSDESEIQVEIDGSMSFIDNNIYLISEYSRITNYGESYIVINN